jgi:hypothetical protein
MCVCVQAAAGLQFTYDKTSYFDEEALAARAAIGPGAKAVGAAVARALGIATAKAAGKGLARSNIVYNRNAASENTASVGTVTELGLGVSGGAYLNRDDDDSALLDQPTVGFAFGR